MNIGSEDKILADSVNGLRIYGKGDYMGFAKYHEDNLKIVDERMYYSNSSLYYPCVNSSYTPKIVFGVYCPLCKKGCSTNNELTNHIISSHGGKQEILYLNNKRLVNSTDTVKCIYSLKLYSFRDEPIQITLIDDFEREYSFWTKVGTYEYDIQNYLKSSIYSFLTVKYANEILEIKQLLDIKTASIDKILSNKYVSDLFYEQISEELLKPEEYLYFIKMLINEGKDTTELINRVEMMHLDADSDIKELYCYYYFTTHESERLPSFVNKKIFFAIESILQGDLSKGKAFLDNCKEYNNDVIGCLLIIGMLENDGLSVDFQERKYKTFGLLGIMEKVLHYYYKYEEIDIQNIEQEVEELRLFYQYPLIRAIIELHESVNGHRDMTYESYSMLRSLTPLAAIYYCRKLDNDEAQDKIYKSMIKIHRNSRLIKQLAFQNNYKWVDKRIFVSDGVLYQKAVDRENTKQGNLYSKAFLNSFPSDDQIEILPLGGERNIGASCFVISYKNYNIMIDCGINPNEYGDDAYPLLDLCEKHIDYIIVSHAHIDHSGGVPKAHAMWKDAKIIMTKPTKVFLKYIYADMAKVRNGISSDFEIQNISIERAVMEDTLNSISTIDFETWVIINNEIKFCLHPAGHIQGAAMVEVDINGRKILYTGDYCNYNQSLTGKFDYRVLPKDVDYLITEFTYVGRKAIERDSQCAKIKSAILDAILKGKSILLPSPSIGRSQELACIIGEMALNGELQDDIKLYLAGMAVPTTTQIIPFMNEKYEKVIGKYMEFDGVEYPREKSIVIASSSSMSKGSASYKISKYWSDNRIKHTIFASGHLDEETEAAESLLDKYYNQEIEQYPLSTHSDETGVFELIEYVSPKVISFTHRGPNSENEFFQAVKRCKERFDNDILCLSLQKNQPRKIFDIYELMKGVN